MRNIRTPGNPACNRHQKVSFFPACLPRDTIDGRLGAVGRERERESATEQFHPSFYSSPPTLKHPCYATDVCSAPSELHKYSYRRQTGTHPNVTSHVVRTQKQRIWERWTDAHVPLRKKRGRNVLIFFRLVTPPQVPFSPSLVPCTGIMRPHFFASFSVGKTRRPRPFLPFIRPQ